MNSTIHNANTKTMGNFYRMDKAWNRKGGKVLSRIKRNLRRQGRRLNKRIPQD